VLSFSLFFRWGLELLLGQELDLDSPTCATGITVLPSRPVLRYAVLRMDPAWFTCLS
jgi:hypothetical protein